MMNFVRCGHAFSRRNLLLPSRSVAPRCSENKPMLTSGYTSEKKLIDRPIHADGRPTKEWTAIAWPTNIQSNTPDGKFGPAAQMDKWGDCWFLATMAAVANDQEGHKILAESIKTVNGGYDVTFKGAPNHSVFISDAELQAFLEANGGDADTRLMELAADKFFNESGNFKSLYISTLTRKGMNQERAEQCLQIFCGSRNIQDPMTYHPIRRGSPLSMGFFMITGMYPRSRLSSEGTPLQRSDVMRFLKRHATNDQDGASVAFTAKKNPLGGGRNAWILVTLWDVIRTEITRDGRLRKQQRAFLDTLNKWLATPDDNTRQALRSAAENLRLQYSNPVKFVDLLYSDQIALRPNHRDILRSGVQEVLAGGPGFIGFAGGHSGTIEGINEATNTFTYSEPSNPTIVHTAELSALIQEIISSNVFLIAFEPTTRQDQAESSHAGEKRGRHLRQIHNQVVRDGKIDPAESAPLANLMEMDDGAFWHVYDSDKNGVIEGGELKAVHLRVDRWVEHFNLTPIS